MGICSAMKLDVLTIGDAFEDVLVVPQDLKVREDRAFASGFSVNFELGDKIPLNDVQYEIGGSACNTAVGFSRLGLCSSILSIIGDDTPAEKIVKRLEQEDVDKRNLIVSKKMKTNFSVIFRLEQGRTIFIYHGLKDYSSLRIKKSVIPKWIFLGPTGDGAGDLHKDIVSLIAEKSAKLAWNPGSIQIREGAQEFRNLLKNTSVLFLNREEAIKFVGLPIRPSAEEAMKRLHTMGAKVVAVTNGKKGAIAYNGKQFFEVPALDVKRVDSTGAGDSFAVGFLGKIIIDENDFTEIPDELINEALKWGIVNSNSVITEIGAQKGLLTKQEIEKSVSKSRL